jgi:carbamoyltransferase
MEYCLEAAGLSHRDVDVYAHAFAFASEEEYYVGQSEYYRELYRTVLSPDGLCAAVAQDCGLAIRDRYRGVPHHLAHAESALVPSGFDRSLVLVSDGLGERYSASVMLAGPEGYEVLHQVPAHSSLGILYGIFTLYLGFEFADGEYKVMGLAPYGDRNRFGHLVMERWVKLLPEGRYAVPLLLTNVEDRDRETYRAALRALERVLGPRRRRGEQIEQRHKDVAAALQSAVESVQLHVLRHFGEETGEDRLCLAGGVGLNCVANGVAQRSGLFSDIFVQPAAGDDGAAIGAALAQARASGSTPRAVRSPALGPAFDRDACRAVVAGLPSSSVEELPDVAEMVASTARLLESGKVVGWFQGRMEFGPRALGYRSILADPRCAGMRDRINALVKKRESFRPFAPAVPIDRASDFFEIAERDAHQFEHMLMVAHVRTEVLESLPATTHVDGSARVQVVDRGSNPLFWGLLTAFGSLTGVPVLLNTSFNVAGQPIVRTPEEAVATYLDAGLDALVIGPFLVVGREPTPRPARARAEGSRGGA